MGGRLEGVRENKKIPPGGAPNGVGWVADRHLCANVGPSAATEESYMSYLPKYLSILALSSATVLGVTVGCSHTKEDSEAASADLTESKLVISQIYGGGGNRNAKYKNDFIELFNRSNEDFSLA